MLAAAKSLLLGALPATTVRRLKKFHYARVVTDPPPEAALLRRLARGTVLDIGANIGRYTHLFAQIAERVYAFEPVPETYDYLNHNRRVHGWRNVALFNVALSDSDGISSMKVPNIYNAEIVPGALDGVRIAIATIDQQYPIACDFIKCDVEGHELAVLRGGRESIARFRPVFWMEISGDYWVAGTQAEHVFRLLREWGYDARFPSLEPVVPPRKATDYLFIPREKLLAVRARLEIATPNSNRHSRSLDKTSWVDPVS